MPLMTDDVLPVHKVETRSVTPPNQGGTVEPPEGYSLQGGAVEPNKR
jgi:hypothetical protein